MSKKINLYVDQGSEFTTTVTVNQANGSPLDMSSYVVDSHIRKGFYANIYSEFECSANLGYISLKLPSTTSYSMKPGKYVYDTYIVDEEGNRTRVQEGVLELSAAVTR